TIYGNSALHLIMADGMASLADAVAADSSTAIYAFLQNLPLAGLTSLVATLLVVIFFVTSADSGALVIDMLASKDDVESPAWQRVFWALAVGAIAIALLAAGGLTALQAGTIAAALPFTVVMILACWGMLRAMRIDLAKRRALRAARIAPPGVAGGDWKGRLRTLVQQPRQREVVAFLREKVKPALEEVAAELEAQALQARVESGEDGRVWIRVGHGEEADFFYSVHPRPYQPPSFMLEDPRRRRDEESRFFRAEVHLREGGQDYDIMGWRKEDVIHDVLDQYHRHMHFL